MASERLRTIRRLADEVREAGLTPFDLCSWEGLLVLTDFTEDIHWTHEVRKGLDAALRRKAEDLDEEHGTDFHTKTLGPG